MAAIRCVAAYSEGAEQYRLGQIVHAHEEELARLMRGAPSSWEVAEGVVRLGGTSDAVGFVNYRDPAPAGADGLILPPEAPDAPAVAAGADGGAPAAPAPVELERLTVAALLRLAAEAGLSLAANTKKADIIAALEAAAAAKGDPVDLSALSDEQLRAYAVEHNVAFPEDAGRVEIIAAIERAAAEGD